MVKSVLVAAFIVLMSAVAYAKSTPALAEAPAGFTCGITTEAITCSWSAVGGATKYSVDADATFDFGGGVTQSVEQDFSTTELTITIRLTEFVAPVDPTTGVTGVLTSVSLKVKGLTTPIDGGQGHLAVKVNQHNPFSGVVTCEVATPTCR